MDITLRDASSIKTKAGCGQTKHQKYWTYLKVLEEKPEILEFLFKNIDESTSKEILIRARDMAPSMGTYFEALGETALHWGLKFSLFTHGIYVTTTTDKDVNPKTGKGYLLLRMRRAKPGDKLSEELSKYLEPAEPGTEQEVSHCFV
jgi:hypothetical protein